MCCIYFRSEDVNSYGLQGNFDECDTVAVAARNENGGDGDVVHGFASPHDPTLLHPRNVADYAARRTSNENRTNDLITKANFM